MYEYRGGCRCQKRMSKIDMRDEGERGPASRRKDLVLDASIQRRHQYRGVNKFANPRWSRLVTRACSNRVLPETGTCSCQPRRGARHQVSALMAGGEVQNIAPSFVVKSSVAFSFGSHQCVGNVIHTQQHEQRSMRTCVFDRSSAIVRVFDMCAQTHKATAGERGLTATSDIVAVGAQGIILRASPLVVLFVVSLTA